MLKNCLSLTKSSMETNGQTSSAQIKSFNSMKLSVQSFERNFKENDKANEDKVQEFTKL